MRYLFSPFPDVKFTRVKEMNWRQVFNIFLKLRQNKIKKKEIKLITSEAIKQSLQLSRNCDPTHDQISLHHNNCLLSNGDIFQIIHTNNFVILERFFCNFFIDDGYTGISYLLFISLSIV